jgi:hypothetical protein
LKTGLASKGKGERGLAELGLPDVYALVFPAVRPYQNPETIRTTAHPAVNMMRKGEGSIK